MSLIEPVKTRLRARWEVDEKGHAIVRRHNLSTSMDPKRRIAEARDLNNNLMRWRVAEGIDLDIIRNANVTILGMGTLGCGVVRTLMVPCSFLSYGSFLMCRDGEYRSSRLWIMELFRFQILLDRVCILLKIVFPGKHLKSRPRQPQWQKSILEWYSPKTEGSLTYSGSMATR